MCVDRDGLTAEHGRWRGHRGHDPHRARFVGDDAAGSGTPRDVADADPTARRGRLGRRRRRHPGADGIRLSSPVALRPARPACSPSPRASPSQLRDCGIELQVEDLDLTGDSLLQQLRWPNDFDTLLTMRALAADPDADLEAFESSHATSADQEVDANPGGYRVGRRGPAHPPGPAKRPTRPCAPDLYGRLQDVLDQDVPAWSVWYDTGWAAIADRVRGPDGPIDTSLPGYAWDIPAWTLEPPVARAIRARGDHAASDRVIMRHVADRAPASVPATVDSADRAAAMMPRLVALPWEPRASERVFGGVIEHLRDRRP